MQQAAIEQLQQELAASREEQELIKAEARQVSTPNLRTEPCSTLPCFSPSLGRHGLAMLTSGVITQAYEDQVALVRMAQSQVEACEDELAARNAEIDALQVRAAALEQAPGATASSYTKAVLCWHCLQVTLALVTEAFTCYIVHRCKATGNTNYALCWQYNRSQWHL